MSATAEARRHAAVAAAADSLVAAFGEGRLADYFACFAPDATFVFHTTDRRLDSVAEYRELWRDWVEADHFEVLACDSTHRLIQVLGDTAVFTHDVRTRVAVRGVEQTLRERETIVFHLVGDRWLAVHEHLSPNDHPDPDTAVHVPARPPA